MNNNLPEEKRHMPLFGIAVFAAEMIFMLTAGAWIQAGLGLWGVAITELCILGFALFGTLFCRLNMKETFPLTPPPPSKFFASAFLFGAVFFWNIAIVTFFMALFPQTADSSEAVISLIRSMPPAVSVLVVAVLPAICEEAFFRGFLLRTTKQFPTALRIVWIGVLFGIAHMSLEKFLPMFLMGAFLAYIATQTDSVFLGILFHFINNLISVCSVYLTDPEAADPAQQFSVTVMIGTALILLSIGTTLFLIGNVLFHRIKPKKALLIPLCAAVVLFYAIGNLCVLSGSTTVAVSERLQLVPEQPSYTGKTFSVPEDSRETVTLSYRIYGSCTDGSVTVTLESDTGIVKKWEGKDIAQSGTVHLQSGNYRVIYTYNPPSEADPSGESPTNRSIITVFMSYT